MRLNDKVEHVTLIAYLLSLIGLILLTALAYGVSGRERKAAQWVQHTEDVIVLSNQVQQHMQGLESSERAYLLTGYVQFRDGIAVQANEVKLSLQGLQALTADNAVQQKNIAALADIITQKMELTDARIYLRDHVGLEQAQQSVMRSEGTEDSELISALSATVLKEEQRLLGTRTAEHARIEANMSILRDCIVVFSIAALSALFWHLNRLLKLKRRAEAQITHLAYHDALTGLPNRRLLLDRLQQNTSAAQRQSGRFALLFMDLDGFKRVNDTLGHDSGDELLQQVAQRLKELLRQSDTVARLGGDEFVIGLTTTETLQDAIEVTDKVVTAIRQPFSLSKGTAHIGASVGISLYPDHSADAESLIMCADKALYRAKQQGKNRYVVYEPAMDVAVEATP